MTDRDRSPAAAPAPSPPVPAPAGAGDPAGADHLTALAQWMVENATSFTPEGLDRAAITAGYPAGDVAVARARATARIHAIDLQPIKATAWRVVAVAYLAVWALFGLAYYLSPPRPLDFEFVVFAVLTVALGVALLLSIGVIRAARPDAERPTRALVLLLVIPVALLLGVAGLCLPTAQIAS
jgi:hypothetical protein